MFKYNAGGHTQEVKVDANENEHSSQYQYTPKKKKNPQFVVDTRSTVVRLF